MRRLVAVLLSILFLSGIAAAAITEHRYDLKLLAHGNLEGPAYSTAGIYDSSKYFYVLNPTDGLVTTVANVNTTQKVYGNGSMFVKNGSYFNIGDSPEFTFGSNNFSISGYIRWVDAWKQTEIYTHIQDANNYDILSSNSATQISFYRVRGGVSTGTILYNSLALNASTWYHIAYIQNNSVGYLYINGTQVATGAGTAPMTDLTGPIRIGNSTNTNSAAHLDEVMIFNGGFAPTIDELYNAGEYPLYLNLSSGGYSDDDHTISLLHFTGANDGTFFNDTAGNRSWSVFGPIVTTTNWSEFPPSSGYSGINGNIYTSDVNDFDMGTGCWTVDVWVRPTSTVQWNTYPVLATSASKGYAVSCTQTGCSIQSNASGSFVTDLSASMSFTQFVPAHIMFSRNLSHLMIFKDGARQGIAAIPSAYKYNTAGTGTVSALVGSNVSYDEFRVSKGISRWSENSNTPTTPYGVTNPSFDATPSAWGTAPVTVQFTDTTSDSAWSNNSFLWEFGDGSISTERNPSHLYAATGVFNVTQHVYNNNMTATATFAYMVGAPVVDFSASPTTGTAALLVEFTDLTTNTTPITSYLLDFGDGSSTTAPPVNGKWTHVYANYGSFSVNLTETNSIGTGFNYKQDYIIVSTEQNPKNTWYSPHAVEFNVWDSRNNPVVGTLINASADSTTFPAGTDWLVDMYGIDPNVANQMMNGTLVMNGTTDSSGSITFTMLTSIKYIIKVVNPSTGLVHTVNVTPLDSMYNVRLPGTAANNTYMDMGYNTSLYITEPDVNNITMNLRYQDMSGRTSLLELYVMARSNNTVINYQSATGFGKGTVLLNYTVRNIRPNQYSWYYNAVRVV